VRTGNILRFACDVGSPFSGHENSDSMIGLKANREVVLPPCRQTLAGKRRLEDRCSFRRTALNQRGGGVRIGTVVLMTWRKN
jgi:hypothetical protein